MRTSILVSGIAAAFAFSGAAFAQSTHVIDFDTSTGLCGGNSDQNVSAMTWYDDFQNGLTLSHEVAIWNPDGSIAAGPVVIPAGSGATLDDIWRRVDINPVNLGSASGYIVGGFNGAGQSDCLAFDVTQTVDSNITFIDATFSGFNTVLERPTNFSVAINGFYGPSFKIGDAGLTIDRSGSCPGSNTVRVSNAGAGETVALLYAATTGNFEIPGGFTCAGTELGLGSTALRIVATTSADADGFASFSGNAPASACGGFIQAVAATSCDTSNVEPLN